MVVVCWSLWVCSTMARVTVGWQCPTLTVTMPAKACQRQRTGACVFVCVQGSGVFATCNVRVAPGSDGAAASGSKRIPWPVRC